MSACADQELLLGGLVDGELDAAHTAIVEAHVARCEGCREELERLEALRNLLKSDGVRHAAPDSLKARIATHPELAPRAANENRLPNWLAPGLAGAVAASLALVTFLGLRRAFTRPPGTGWNLRYLALAVLGATLATIPLHLHWIQSGVWARR